MFDTISAHGTNPASAQMCGMEVSIVKCDNLGNVDLNHLDEKIKEAGNKLAALMITYPSTHGVFESQSQLSVKKFIMQEARFTWMVLT